MKSGPGKRSSPMTWRWVDRLALVFAWTAGIGLCVIAGADGYDPRQYAPRVQSYTEMLEGGVEGLKIAVVKEGFGQHDSHADVDATVCTAAQTLERLGAQVSEVSIAWHPIGLAIWAAIGIEGTYNVMYGSASVARHIEGFYPVSLAARLASMRDRANELPDTVKVGMLLGCYTDTHYQGYFYFKAQSLRRRLRAEYDRVLNEHDLLLMPTTRMMASKIPPPDAPLAELMDHSWQQIGNTCPFNVTHHPAISVPCGLGEGERPIGLMLIGKHWQESTLYRAADAFEQAGNWQKMGPKSK